MGRGKGHGDALDELLARIESTVEVAPLGRALQELVRRIGREAPRSSSRARAREVLRPLLTDRRVYEVEGEGWGAPAAAYGIGIGALAKEALDALDGE